VLVGLYAFHHLECDRTSCGISALLVGGSPTGLRAPNRRSSGRLPMGFVAASRARSLRDSSTVISRYFALRGFIHDPQRPFVRTEVDTGNARGVWMFGWAPFGWECQLQTGGGWRWALSMWWERSIWISCRQTRRIDASGATGGEGVGERNSP
jgi:hypothetical protein